MQFLAHAKLLETKTNDIAGCKEGKISPTKPSNKYIPCHSVFAGQCKQRLLCLCAVYYNPRMKWELPVNFPEHSLNTRMELPINITRRQILCQSLSTFLCGTTPFMMQNPIIEGRSLSRAMSSGDPWPPRSIFWCLRLNFQNIAADHCSWDGLSFNQLSHTSHAG